MRFKTPPHPHNGEYSSHLFSLCVVYRTYTNTRIMYIYLRTYKCENHMISSYLYVIVRGLDNSHSHVLFVILPLLHSSCTRFHTLFSLHSIMHRAAQSDREILHVWSHLKGRTEKVERERKRYK